jgi:hypothetical protein
MNNKPEFMNWALESLAHKPLAIVIMGNPRYIDDPKLRVKATALYCKIKMFLQNRYEVRFDAGKPFTLPDTHAQLWVAHSRGIDRLQYAPKGIKTIALQTQDHDQQYETDDQRGRDPLHYELSEQDVKALMSA